MTRLGRRVAWVWVLLLLTAGLSACSNLGYYGQALRGHWQLLRAARPTSQWLADPATSPALAQRLRLAREMRAFAIRELGLPGGPSYRSYAGLQRAGALWNVVAAPPDSLQLKSWCYPLVGCMVYRGYFDRGPADDLAAALQADGAWETMVYAVPAYSTLGWGNWLGGDPLLSTFVWRPEGDLARLLFHELAHQALFVRGDSTFNESWATAVGELGAQQWLAMHAGVATRRQDARRQQQRRAFRQLLDRTSRELEQVYEAAEPDWGLKKQLAMARFRQRYADLQRQWKHCGWPVAGTMARWVARANNASFGAQAAYDRWVPAFRQLFADQAGDWARFHEAVRDLAGQPESLRDAELQVLMQRAADPAAGAFEESGATCQLP